MRSVRVLLIVVVGLLAFAVAGDLSLISMGSLTADAYYLPLRSIPLGSQRDQVEAVIVQTHGGLLRYQRLSEKQVGRKMM